MEASCVVLSNKVVYLIVHLLLSAYETISYYRNYEEMKETWTNFSLQFSAACSSSLLRRAAVMTRQELGRGG